MGSQMTMDELFGDKIAAGSFGEPHLACVLLLDISGSMHGDAIKSLNAGLAQFKKNVLADSIARKRVDVAIVTFASEVNVVSDFVPVSQMPTPQLEAFGETKMAEGIDKAIELVKERTRMYQQLGTPCHKPWIFMITDGASTSDYEAMRCAAVNIQEAEDKGSHGRLTFWALGVSGYDQEELFGLTKRVMELKNQDFTDIFDWLSESMSVISQSQVGENITFGDLPRNARKAEEGRKIDEGWY